jgi:predicted O-methyltransferase YrrM
MNETINSIFASGKVQTVEGKTIPLHSNIDASEGKLLFDLIRGDTRVKKTLEVGCAYGLSSLHICEALRDRKDSSHTIVDPLQKTQWQGIGIHNLRQAGFSNFELIEEKSEFALPHILGQGEACFDLVFIDGWHTFDHTLLDCFYGTRLLAVGGYLVVDDAQFPSIRKAIDYLLNYPCYDFVTATSRRRSFRRQLLRLGFSLVPRKLKRGLLSGRFSARLKNQTMVALKKIAVDDRDWDWHNDNF